MVKKCTTHSDGSRTSLRDWVKFNFMGKDITSFTTLVSGYKATIMIALGDANLRTSKVTVELLRKYKAMISSTTFDLEEILQDLNTAMHDPHYEETAALGERAGELTRAVDEERESIQQCLTICMEVSQHIDQVQTKSLSPQPQPRPLRVVEPSPETSSRASPSVAPAPDLPRLITSKSLSDCRRGIGYTTVQLHARLQDLNRQIAAVNSTNTSSSGPTNATAENMKEVADAVKQCLNICGEAAEQASADRINVFEDVRMGDEGHQLILSTIGDLISAKRVTVGARSSQWLGQMSDSSLQQLSKDRGVRVPSEVGSGGKLDIGKGLYFENRHGLGRTYGASVWHEIELVIEELSSTGDGLARSPAGNDHVFAIPFCLPGETVLGRVRKSAKGRWSNGDFVRVLQASPLREGVSPGCKYFTLCSGCQFQMLPYNEQLAHKKGIVERAFRNFSDLPAETVPPVEETGSSPMQYGYRTKLTPHFDRPRDFKAGFTTVPPIGFGQKGYRHVMDIENCPLGTAIVQEGMRSERARIAANIASYKAGATILLRESTARARNDDDGNDELMVQFSPSARTPLLTMPAPSRTSAAISTPDGPQQSSYYDSLPYHDVKTCISAPNALTTEYISTSSLRFDTRASSFFQNNNSILPSFLTHLRSVAQPSLTAATKSNHSDGQLKYLLDAYCGSGLLSLSLSPLFLSVLGIEIDSSSVAQATANARLNRIDNCGFIEADAADLFADVPYPPAQTVLVIDPPRKGCSVEFLRQMLRWGPARVCYNKNGQNDDHSSSSGWHAYEIESLKGWDFFPQTGHVEGFYNYYSYNYSSYNYYSYNYPSYNCNNDEQETISCTDVWDAIKDEVEAQVKENAGRSQQK
ncbi:hypothetical protein DV736_g4396, partial [Chaetothyriales sp. CBS 134916]